MPRTIVSSRKRTSAARLPRLGRVDGQGHRQAAVKQDDGVDRAERHVQVPARRDERRRVRRAGRRCRPSSTPPKNITSVARNIHMPSVRRVVLLLEVVELVRPGAAGVR